MRGWDRMAREAWLASHLPLKVLCSHSWGDLGRDELGQRLEGPQRLPAVSYVVAGSDFFLMC